ncbi:MAG: YnfA family protein [Candidatus Cloacimonetes bacterium]|nr:YnfA family protein [Candidatus Cloacimonadota bacterium]
MESTKILSHIILIYFGAALFEIIGCFCFWGIFRLNKAFWWAIPGTVSLILFAFLLTKVDMIYSGRIYAAYGGIYILSSILWLWIVEQQKPDFWDTTGATLCMLGALVILLSTHD